jgi:MATE family multidrug resistance protein
MTPIVPANRSRIAGESAATARLALPLVFAQLSAVGMNVIDTLLAGHLDAGTLGAVAVGTSVWTLAIVIAIGVMMAVPPSVAHLVGGGQRQSIAPLFQQALWLAMLLGIGLGIVVATAGPLLFGVIGIDAQLVPDARRFLRAIAFGAPAFTLFLALRGLCEGLGRTRPSLYFSFLGLVLLGPIGYVLMYGRFGLPPLRALGSGIATACVLWIQGLAMLAYVLLRRHFGDLRLLARFGRPDPRAIGGLLRLGVPMGVTVFMEASLFIAVALALATLGTGVIASHQIAVNVASVAFMIPLGIAMATTIRVGHAAGRADADGVRRAGLAGFGLTVLTQVGSAAIMIGMPDRVASWYTHDPAIVALAAQLLVLAGLFQLSDGIQVAANGALRGLKDTRVPMFLTTFAYWGIGMPAGLWLAFRAGYGARGMWIGLIAGLSVAAALLSLRFWRVARRDLVPAHG